MAGNYPDVPGQWMHYDKDGSVMFRTDRSTTSVQLTTTEVAEFMKIGGGGVYMNEKTVGLIFPEIRDIAGFVLSSVFEHSAPYVETSTNSTNGIDGTWTTRATGLPTPGTGNLVTSRTIHQVSYTAITGIRWTWNGPGPGGEYNYRGPIGLFGHIDPTVSPNRLRVWHPTLDQAMDLNANGAYLDWGNAMQGSSEDRTFRIKNESDTLTANNVVVSAETPTTDHATIPFVGQLSLSLDGVSFAQQQNIVAIAPNAISPVITVRRVTPSNAPISVWWARIAMAANTWT